MTSNLRDIQQTMQQSTQAAREAQILANQRGALAQAAQDTRMAAIQGRMAEQAQGQIELAQARSQPLQPTTAMTAAHYEPFEAQHEELQRIKGSLQPLKELQGRVKENLQQAAESLRKAAEARRQAREAQRSSLPEDNRRSIEVLGPIAEKMQDKPGEVLILFWDWEGGGVLREQDSVGHVASAIKISDHWIIIHSQFPHETGGKAAPVGPNTTIALPRFLFKEEGRRKPNSAYLVTVPNMGGFAKYMMHDLEKPFWALDPARPLHSTNCTYGTIHGLRAGGVPLSYMWANQTLIVPGAPYLPRDLRTALKRDEHLNEVHNFKILRKDELVEAIQWEEPPHD